MWKDVKRLDHSLSNLQRRYQLSWMRSLHFVSGEVAEKTMGMQHLRLLLCENSGRCECIDLLLEILAGGFLVVADSFDERAQPNPSENGQRLIQCLDDFSVNTIDLRRQVERMCRNRIAPCRARRK